MDRIDVVAAFSKEGKVLPRKFRYGQKIYSIAKINLERIIKKGANRIIIFDVSDEANDWTLIYETESTKWYLQNLENQYSSS